MNKRIDLTTVARVATALFLTALVFFSTLGMSAAKTKKNSVYPDFAYPKSVKGKASDALRKAASEGKWSDGMAAAIQLVTAENLVSNENAAPGLLTLDSIAKVAPQVWRPAFLLVEADIYNSLYRSVRWQADQRKLALDSIPESPYEWSRDMFAQKVFTLCSEALADKANADTPLKEWSTFLTNTSDATKYGVTVREFVAQRCFDLLGEYSDVTKDLIPFFNKASVPVTPAGKCTALRNQAVDELISEASARNQSLILAIALAEKTSCLPQSQQMRGYMSDLDRVKDTEGSQFILMKLRNYVSDDSGADPSSPLLTKKEYLQMLRASLDKWPKGRYANALVNIINGLTEPVAEVAFKNQYLSSTSIVAEVKLTNCNEAWFLVYDYAPYLNASDSPSTKVMVRNCRLAKAVKATVAGETPFSAETKIEIGKLPKGCYVIVPSSTPDSNGIFATVKNETWRNTFRVSDISVMSLRRPDGSTDLFVVDGADGRPVEDATVKVYSIPGYRQDRKLIATYSTDKDGHVKMTEKRFEIKASYNGSEWGNNTRYYNSTQRHDTTVAHFAHILPDKAVCHPGDTIKAVVVGYDRKNSDCWLTPNAQITVSLKDANFKQVAEKKITTDEFGRCTAEFVVPDDGLLGAWSLYASDMNGMRLGSESFQVADYVAPTFFITTEHSAEDVTPGDVVSLKGKVLTYSGMPLAGADVKYHVTYCPPMRWWYGSNGATYDSSVTTDGEGKYEITLPTGNLKGTRFERGIFTISLTATSPAGETQNGPTERFAVGREYRLSPSASEMSVNVSDSVEPVNIYVLDMLGRKVTQKVRYTLAAPSLGKIVAQGDFESPALSLPLAKLPSAKYVLNATLAEDTTARTRMEIVTWKDTDNCAPQGTGLWIPERTLTAKAGEGKVRLTIGNGKGNRWIPVVESGDDKVMSFQWVYVEKDNVSVDLNAPMGDSSYTVSLNSLSNLENESATVTINPAIPREIEVKTVSFRDKISAGDKERWSFMFTKGGSALADMPAMAVMTDAALNAIAPLNWNFKPAYGKRSAAYYMNVFPAHVQNQTSVLLIKRNLNYSDLAFPDINDYGQGWGIGRRFYGGVYYLESADMAIPTLAAGSVMNEMKMMKSEKSRAAAAPMYDGAASSDAEAVEEEAVEEAPVDEGAAPADSQTQLRETECPVAFFMPYLNSDNDGVVSLDFTVPNFNTTWALQVVGYDRYLQTAKVALEAVASKPVMVSTHAPAFVRTGDELLLTATLFNNSGASCAVSGRIELVDLVRGRVIEAREFAPENMDNSASRLIEMHWSVPSDVSAVGFRAYAESGNHSDGEQALVPVLPASSPIVESTPFWIAPGADGIEVTLPKFKDTDRITLQYCDNPVWYCITALPDIVNPDSKSVTAKMRAIYGNAMAYNLISSNAGLKAGLAAMLSDKNAEFAAIKSNLEKDGALKITDLNNTPWVNDAASETLRMSRLSTLLDDAGAKKTIGALLDDIRKLQTPDGGWSWCPDMGPSPYITRSLLSQFAMMHKAGAMKELDGAEKMVKSAIAYVDAETVKDYRKYHKKGESLSYLLDWIYVRSQFPASYLTGRYASEMTSLAERACGDIAKEWKDMGIGAKSKAAMVLWRADRREDASAILESLRQFTSETPEKGVWFDNLESGWNGMGTLLTTTLALEAFAEIQPQNKIIDGLRQWLILGRQMQDWGNNTYTVETVNAILTSGSDWTKTPQASAPEIYIKGKLLQLPATAAMTGAFTMTLSAREASKKKLKVSRSASGPAWGGVLAQYEAPIMEVKPADVPDLTIRKDIVALVEGPDGTMTPKQGITLKKGMKVRVTLTIEASRDMDYVALTDERSACLQPEEQLSGVAFSDGVGYYREVRNARTNLFFDRLPKGHHVINYECSVSQEGEFSCGIATVQSLYSPLITAHSAGQTITVE